LINFKFSYGIVMKNKPNYKKTFAGFTLLYVEDNEEIRQMNAEVLNKFFKQVDQAEDGLHGWQLFQDNVYDIVISDIQMPNMNGLELSEKIKEKTPDQPIVITSAYDDSPSLLRLIQTGVSNFILKPFAATQLLDVLLPITQHLQNTKDLAVYRRNLESMVEEKSHEISNQNRFMHNIIQSLKIPFVVVDRHSGLIIEANSEAIPAEKIGQTTIHQLLCNQNQDCEGRNYPCAVKMALNKKEPASFEKVMLYKDLGPRFVRVEAFPVLDEFGEVEKTLVYLIDVTAYSQKEIGHIAEEGKLKLQLVQQTLVADLAKILNCSASFKAVLKSALFFLGGNLEIPRVAVFRVNTEKKRFDLLEEVATTAEGKKIGYVDRLSFADFNQEKVNKLLDGGSLAYPDLHKLSTQARAICESYKIGSLLILPITIDNTTVGILVFLHHHEHFWNYKSFALYASITNLLANTWGRSE